jgi:phage/plasmid-like protein (TIGR03299 family)
VVSSKFEVVQPAEVLEFFRDLTELGRFKMETAGVLFDGKKIWALARHAGELKLAGNDVIKPYLLLATGMDGTLATNAQFTTVRVVCNNTLQMSLRQDAKTGIRVTHRTRFNEARVKKALGLVDDMFDQFSETATRLAEKKVTSQAVVEDYMARVFNTEYEYLEPDDKREYIESPNIRLALETQANFIGQQTASADGTAWGLVNGVTAFLDHVRNTRTVDARLNKTWFGDGVDIKQRAVNLALEL